MAVVWKKNAESAKFDWDRSFSEPDLTDPAKHLSRFAIKHPHEYISVDDLKFFRRRKPPDNHTRSNICLHNNDETVLPFSSLKSEYTKQYHNLELSIRPRLLRRSTSLRLEGLMHHLSEHQEQFHWYSPEDCQSCRCYPIRYPENLYLGADDIGMDPEYRSSYISYPMVDRTSKILPREMFRIEPDATTKKTAARSTSDHQFQNQNQHSQQTEEIHQNSLDCSAEEFAAIKKLSEDKFKRDLAAKEQHRCHLQQRDTIASNAMTSQPSEYQRQFIQLPLGKAHSIPQISHFKMHGDFLGVPEYSASFKMYDNYSKSAPIKKADNLQQSGAEAALLPTAAPANEVPEYNEKFRGPPRPVVKDKSLKTEDHLHPRGEFSKDLPEYHESFKDPHVTQMPERGKCRESYLRLKGKIDFNPEYRSTYLDFPRSRPIVKKSTSSFRLPTNTSSTTTTADPRSPKRTPRRKYKSSSPTRYGDVMEPALDLTATPEYRRAQYNYQLRERTPPRKIVESDGGGNAKFLASNIGRTRKSSLAYPQEPTGKITNGSHKRRTSRHRAASILDKQQSVSTPSSFDNVIGTSAAKMPARFGRRASVLQNAANCRENSSIIEGNPKYTLSTHQDKYNRENQESFVVLKEPCKRTNWMKKSWYES